MLYHCIHQLQRIQEFLVVGGSLGVFHDKLPASKQCLMSSEAALIETFRSTDVSATWCIQWDKTRHQVLIASICANTAD